MPKWAGRPIGVCVNPCQHGPVAGPLGDPRPGALRGKFHERYSATPELPVPVEAIAEDLLGLCVVEEELDGVSGLLFPAERTIYLNAAEAPTRRRFTLAHELGHWVCQHLEGRTAPVYCRTEEVGVGEGRKLEREANIFAAELLMPEDDVRGATATDVAAAATRFAVSGEAMQWRLYSFGMVDERPR